MRRKDISRSGFLYAELVTALVILAIAIVPILAMQVRSMTFSKQMYHKSIIRQMLSDRIEILKAGGWEKYGICNSEPVDFIGSASENIPSGNLLLTIEKFEGSKNVLKITLCWKAEHPSEARTVLKEVLVYAPGYNKLDKL